MVLIEVCAKPPMEVITRVKSIQSTYWKLGNAVCGCMMKNHCFESHSDKEYCGVNFPSLWRKYSIGLAPYMHHVVEHVGREILWVQLANECRLLMFFQELLMKWRSVHLNNHIRHKETQILYTDREYGLEIFRKFDVPHGHLS